MRDDTRCAGSTTYSPAGIDWHPCCVDCSRRVVGPVQALLLREKPLTWKQWTPAGDQCEGRESLAIEGAA